MRAWNLALIVMLLAGCASPRYQSVKHYAAGNAAPACLKACVDSEQICKQGCQAKREACIQTIEPEAKTRYEAAMRRHEQDLNAYRWELERYRQELAWGYYGSGWGYYTWFPPFPPPPPPAAPTLAGEQKRLERERCDQDCGCQGSFDACYLGCGGQITHEMQCVANCPPPKP